MKEVLPGIYSYTCREIRSCPEQYVIRAKDGSCVVQGTLAASETERWRDTRYGKLVHLSAAGNTQDATRKMPRYPFESAQFHANRSALQE